METVQIKAVTEKNPAYPAILIGGGQHDGKWASSFDFARIPRRGYSFARCPVPKEHYLPEDIEQDGMFLINLETGERTLTVSYKQVMDIAISIYITLRPVGFFWVTISFQCSPTIVCPAP